MMKEHKILLVEKISINLFSPEVPLMDDAFTLDVTETANKIEK